MTTAVLADVCDITMGQAPKGDSYNDVGEGVPLIAGAGDFGVLYPKPKKYTTATGVRLSQPGDIVLGIRASIGDKVLADGTYCLGRGVAGLRAGPHLDQRYLWNWVGFAAPSLAAKGRGATFLQVNRRDISEMEIPLPPIEEQRRIAAVLDAADALRAKRRQALAKLDTLRSSIVAEQLRVYPDRDFLGDHLSFVTSGSRGWAKFYAEAGARFIRTQDVLLGEVDEEDPAFVTPPDNAESRRTVIRDGDLLVTITGVVGRVVAAPADLAGAFISQHVAIARPAGSLRPKFAEAFMCSRPGQVQLERAQYGQTKPGLNLNQIRAFELPVPTLAEQDALLRELEAVDAQVRVARQSSAQIDVLFGSLQQRAFKGEL